MLSFSYMLSNKVLRFLSEIEIDILPLVVTSEIIIFIFTVSKNGLFMSSGLKVFPKGLKCSILV